MEKVKLEVITLSFLAIAIIITILFKLTTFVSAKTIIPVFNFDTPREVEVKLTYDKEIPEIAFINPAGDWKWKEDFDYEDKIDGQITFTTDNVYPGD